MGAHKKTHGHRKVNSGEHVSSDLDVPDAPVPNDDDDANAAHLQSHNSEEQRDRKQSQGKGGAVDESGMTTEPPQIWVRVTSSSLDIDNDFDLHDDSKKIRLLGDPAPRFHLPHGELLGYCFNSNGVLLDTSQKDVFQRTVKSVMTKALNGIPGVVISIGSKHSGKSETMFNMNDYNDRGMVFRSLERAFEIAVDRKSCGTTGRSNHYSFELSMVDIHRNQLVDLMALDGRIVNIGKQDGPTALKKYPFQVLEEGFLLIMRGLEAQRHINRKPYSLSHTIVYFHIVHVEKGIDTKVTFAELGSLTGRDFDDGSMKNSLYPADDATFGLHRTDLHYWCPCEPVVAPALSAMKDNRDEIMDGIAIRKDIYSLEEMCMQMCSNNTKSEKLTSPLSAHRNKLAFALKDLVCGHAELRIIVHLRPEKAYISPNLQCIRFAERVKHLPFQTPSSVYKEDTPHQTIPQESSLPEPEVPSSPKPSATKAHSHETIRKRPKKAKSGRDTRKGQSDTTVSTSTILVAEDPDTNESQTSLRNQNVTRSGKKKKKEVDFPVVKEVVVSREERILHFMALKEEATFAAHKILHANNVSANLQKPKWIDIKIKIR